MKILFPNWKTLGLADIKEAFEKLGHQVILYAPEPRDYRLDPKFKSGLKKEIRKQGIDIVFSSNYYPVISEACQSLDIPYLSWCYDNPLILTYSKTILNPCNRIFLFDSQMAEDLKVLGMRGAYYLPMAVNAERLAALHPTGWQQQNYSADVSFVGSLYTEQHTLYDRMENLDDRTRGYLEGVMHSQQMIYGYSFLESVLTPDIIDNMLAAMPVGLHRDGFEDYAYIYANYFLYRKITQTERTQLLQSVSEALPDIQRRAGRDVTPLKLYTPAKTPALPLVKNMGPVDYNDSMPLVFRLSKINLNITLRSIKNGIPLRAMDIMGAGGFLLTNHQNDFALHFTDGEDYISYSSPEDLLDKLEYYLTHEEERMQIAENGQKKVCREHTYRHRAKEMLQTIT